MREMGILQNEWPMSHRDSEVPPWEEVEEKEWEQRRMEAYAAQIDRMDQGIGRILDAYEASGRLENTVVVFLSDNGGCAEDIPLDSKKLGGIGSKTGPDFTRDGSRRVRYGNDPSIEPGGEDSYCSYGRSWANLSNTPFRMFKCWTHEGGIATPFIVHWPAGISEPGGLRHQPAQLPDVMATFADLAGAIYPVTYRGRTIPSCEGFSMRPLLRCDAPFGRKILAWEHEGNAGLRKGKWKLVKDHHRSLGPLMAQSLVRFYRP